jgi:hypothetical protein
MHSRTLLLYRYTNARLLYIYILLRVNARARRGPCDLEFRCGRVGISRGNEPEEVKPIECPPRGARYNTHYVRRNSIIYAVEVVVVVIIIAIYSTVVLPRAGDTNN